MEKKENTCVVHDSEIKDLQQSLESLKKNTIANIENNINGLRQSNHSINNSLQRLESNLNLIADTIKVLPDIFKKIENIEEVWIDATNENEIPGKFNLHQFLNKVSKINDDLTNSVDELVEKISDDNLFDSTVNAILKNPDKFVAVLKKIIKKDNMLDLIIEAIKTDPDKFITAYKKVQDTVMVEKANSWSTKTGSISSTINLILTILNILVLIFFGQKLL